MSRTLAASFTTEKNLNYARPFMSVVFHFGGSIGDIYVSDRAVTIGGNVHEGAVKRWGSFQSVVSQRDGTFQVNLMNVDLINFPLFGSPAKRFSDLWFGLGAESVEVDVYQNFLQVGSSTILQETLFPAVMRVRSYTPAMCAIELVSVSEKYSDKKEVGLVISQSNFSNAAAADIGKRANIVYGSVKKVPCHVVSTGLKSVVRAQMAIGVTAVAIHDDFYDALPATGSVTIGTETITYTAKAGSAGNRTLTCSATTKQHNKDDTIIQVVTSWIYLVAGHAMKALGTIYVKFQSKLIPLPASAYTADLANTTLLSGQTLTTLTFTTPPLTAIKDAVVIDNSTNEQQWQQAGSDENINLPGGSLPAATCEQTPIALTFPAQDKTKSSGNFTKRFVIGVVGSGAPAAGEIQLVKQGDSCPTAAVLVLYAGDAGFITSPQVIQSDHWNLAIRRKNVSGSTISVPARTVNITAKTESYNILSSIGLNPTSTADNPIGEIYFDGDGYADDGSGTYTGTADALIQKPADVIHHLARAVGGIPVGRIDVTALQTARTDAPSYHAFSAVITERTNLKQLLLAMGMQARIAIDWPADKLTGRLLKASYGAASKVITQENIMEDGQQRTTLKAEHTDPEDLINTLSVYYGRDWSVGRNRNAFNKVIKTSDATSISRYGIREEAERFLFDFIGETNGIMAEDLAAFWLSRLKEPGRLLSFDCKLDQYEILNGDLVALDFATRINATLPATLPFTLGESFDGLDGHGKFLIEQIRLAPGSLRDQRGTRLALMAREVT